MRPAVLSAAGGELLRAIVRHVALGRESIPIGRFRSFDWQSLTFTGERHELSLRLTGPDAAPALQRLRAAMATAEWQLFGHVVADIVIVDEEWSADGSVRLEIEALTLSDRA